jgi:Na+-transporting methylmalonyl-CoA/oxaloacetate decarboxylase gamma subunit
MIEVVVGVGVVVVVVGGLVALAIWVSRMRVTEVKGERREPKPGEEYLTEDDFNELLIEEGGEDGDDAG